MLGTILSYILVLSTAGFGLLLMGIAVTPPYFRGDGMAFFAGFVCFAFATFLASFTGI